MLLLLLGGAGAGRDPGYGPSFFAASATAGTWVGAMPYYSSGRSSEWVGAIVAPPGPPIATVGAAPPANPDPEAPPTPDPPTINFVHANYDPSTADLVIYVDPDGGGDYTTLDAANAALSSAAQWTTVYLKRGHTYTNPTFNVRSGIDAARPFTVAAYGTGTRPTIIPSRNSFKFDTVGPNHDIYLRGLRFYDPSMDTTNPANDGIWNEQWTKDGVPFAIDQLYITGGTQGLYRFSMVYCLFDYIGVNMTNRNVPDALTSCYDVTIYRNIFRRSWTYIADRAQGINSYDFPMLFRENILEHGGWASDRTTGATLTQSDGTLSANQYNHNMYLSRTRNQIIEKNVSIDASSICIKVRGVDTGDSVGLVIRDNLTIGGEIGISAIGQANGPGKSNLRAIVAPTIEDNVILRPGEWRPGGRTLGWGFDLADCIGGSVSRNLAIAATNTSVTNSRGFVWSGPMESITFEDNGLSGFRTDEYTYSDGARIGGTWSTRAVTSFDPLALLPGGSKNAYIALLLAMDETNWDTDIMAEAVNQTMRAAAGW